MKKRVLFIMVALVFFVGVVLCLTRSVHCTKLTGIEDELHTEDTSQTDNQLDSNDSNRDELSLGNGINIGNSLDVYLKNGKNLTSISAYEEYWGNPPIEKEIFSMLSDKGFKSVRIPVSWGNHLQEEDQIDPLWLNRVSEVVHYALEEQLYVILDLHHETWLVPVEKKEEEVSRRFTKIWTQIAQAFEDVDEKLIFESMNEPRLVDTELEWRSGNKEAQDVVNRLNRIFIETIRKAGGYNKDRYLLIPAYCTSGQTEALEALDKELFVDDKIYVAVHAYYPYKFTLDEEGTSHFDKDNESDTRDIDRLADDLNRIFLSDGIKVVITEFSAHDKDNDDERLEWLDYYLDTLNGINVPCFWWDNGKTSRLLSRNSLRWRKEALADRLLEWN